jgi:hypothetical protein
MCLHNTNKQHLLTGKRADWLVTAVSNILLISIHQTDYFDSDDVKQKKAQK